MIGYDDFFYLFLKPKKNVKEELESDAIVEGQWKNLFQLKLDFLFWDVDSFTFFLEKYAEKIGIDYFLANYIAKDESVQEKTGEIEWRKEKWRFSKIKIQTKDYTNLYVGKDIVFSAEKRKMYPFFAIVGTSGSGKTTLLLQYLLNILFSTQTKKIFFFDTQKTFQNDLFEIIKPLYAKKIEIFAKNEKIQIFDEKTFFVDEYTMVEFINFLFEEEGVLEKTEKEEILDYAGELNFSELKKHIEKKLERMKEEKKLITKYQQKKKILSNLLYILEKVKIIEEPVEYNTKINIFQFEEEILYELLLFSLSEQIKKELKEKKGKETWIFFDETEKYLSNEKYQEFLTKIMREKRQFGLRVFATLNTVDQENLSVLRNLFSTKIYRTPDGIFKQQENWKEYVPKKDEIAVLNNEGLKKTKTDLFFFDL